MRIISEQGAAARGGETPEEKLRRWRRGGTCQHVIQYVSPPQRAMSCHFCGWATHGKEDAITALLTRTRINEEADSISILTEATQVVVPRCAACRAKHDQQARICDIFGQSAGGLVVVAIILPVIVGGWMPTMPEDSLGAALMWLGFVGTLLLVGSLLAYWLVRDMGRELGRLIRPNDIPPESAAQSFEPVKGLLGDGWMIDALLIPRNEPTDGILGCHFCGRHAATKDASQHRTVMKTVHSEYFGSGYRDYMWSFKILIPRCPRCRRLHVLYVALQIVVPLLIGLLLAISVLPGARGSLAGAVGFSLIVVLLWWFPSFVLARILLFLAGTRHGLDVKKHPIVRQLRTMDWI